MLVKENNEKEASQMMNDYLSLHEKTGLLDWLVLFGGKNRERKQHATTTDSLQEHLQKCEAGYKILHVNIPDNFFKLILFIL